MDGDRAEVDRSRRAACRACGCAGSPRGRRGPAAAPRSGGRSGPGRSSAGSSASGRLVAAITITLSLVSNPSISVRIWLSVCSRSSWPPLMPDAALRARPIASSSSMKMIAGRGLLGLLEEVAHARGADADDRLDELRRRGLEERHVGLARDGARQQRLAGAGQAVEHHAARDPRAEARVALGPAQEVDDLVQLVLGLVDTGDVVERDARLAALRAPRARAREAAEAAGAARARGAAHQPDQQADDQDRRPEREHEASGTGCARCPAGVAFSTTPFCSSWLVSCIGVDERRDLRS